MLKWNPDFSSLQGKQKLVRKIGDFENSRVKLVFDWGGERTFGSSYREVRKTEVWETECRRNRYSTETHFLLSWISIGWQWIKQPIGIRQGDGEVSGLRALNLFVQVQSKYSESQFLEPSLFIHPVISNQESFPSTQSNTVILPSISRTIRLFQPIFLSFGSSKNRDSTEGSISFENSGWLSSYKQGVN